MIELKVDLKDLIPYDGNFIMALTDKVTGENVPFIIKDGKIVITASGIVNGINIYWQPLEETN